MKDESYPIEFAYVCPCLVRGYNTLCHSGKPFVPYSIPVKQTCRAWNSEGHYCMMCESDVNE